MDHNVNAKARFIKLFFFKFLFIYDSHRERERERERQRRRQREKQAPCREPDGELDLGSLGSGPGLQAALNRCATGLPEVCFFYSHSISGLLFSFLLLV